MQDLTVALFQADLAWEDKESNLRNFEAMIAALPGGEDLIVLPEMFSTGFSMSPEGLAEGMNGPTVAWMQRQAQERGAAITGSLIIEENGAYFNRLLWVQPDGVVQCYDKRHLFSMAGEEKVYFAGTEKLLVEWKGWKICPLICYDLRFPAWIRNRENYDLLLFVANWPERRHHHWRTLLQARAIENQCYVLGVNRVGEDGNKLPYLGSTLAADPQGLLLGELQALPGALRLSLPCERIAFTRRYMPFLKDMDEFEVRVGG